MATLNTKNIVPLTEFQRSPGKLVKRAVHSHEPMVVTQHGRPVVVMMDCETFEAYGEKTISDRERLLRDELQRVTTQIATRYEPEQIILFGSLASGHVNESSDIDLVIIKKTTKRFWERQKELARLVRPKLACDFFVYTPEEWDQAVREKHPFVSREITGGGKILYDRAA